MSDLQNGSLVQHAKLRLPAARALLRTDGFEPNTWLAGLTAFSLDAESGRYALAATWLTHDQAVEQFLAAQPGGFAAADEETSGKPPRASRWRSAQEAFARKLSAAEVERLLNEGEIGTLVSRAVDVEKLIAPLHPPADVGAVKAALADPATARSFFVSLSELLSVPSPGRARFEPLFAAARALPVEPAQQWLVATLFPFLAAPDRNVLLRPRTTCSAAERLGSDLRFDAIPNWTTYSALRALSVRLLERLAPAGAKDFIDVETFLHATAATRRPSTTAARAAAVPGKPARKAAPRGSRRATT